MQSTGLARDIATTDSEVTDTSHAIAPLRVSAYASLVELIGGDQVDTLLRQLAIEDQVFTSVQDAEKSFEKWSAYLNSLEAADIQVSIDDLLSFATVGLLARRPTDVHMFLRKQFVRESLDSLSDKARRLSWDERVRYDISLALLLLIRQENHLDIRAAGDVIRRLSDVQSEAEGAWLSSLTSQQRGATAMLGLYHLAQAVVRISEFLLSGAVESDGERITDLGPELRRLLVRAEEYLSLAGSLDIQLWLSEVAIVMWRLRADSIWIIGRGISERLDQLIDELVDAARSRPIFSLLPSQQEALRKSLLDPMRVAVVLQMPTSSGKTLLAEFSIVQAFEAYRGQARVAYVVPTRALATQIRRTLSEDLRPLGIEVAAAGSAFEEDPYELQLLESTDGVVVSTPEKLDLLLRAHPKWFNDLRLIVVDEAHLLHESERGVRLELLLATIRREHPQTRLLLLTPFLSNADQIASWLGENRGLPIQVHWRPSRLLLGIATIAGSGENRAITLELEEPERVPSRQITLRIPTRIPHREVNTTTKKVAYLAKRFLPVGTVLSLYTLSRVEAERAAEALIDDRPPLEVEEQSAALRVAIALAQHEYGADSLLARCLERRSAFHHSALSPILRYLIEDQVRAGTIDFVAATTTLAQGMNFPVATVLIHSLHKPYGKGPLSPAEFWNIAGRAGRVGLIDQGLVIFANPEHEPYLDNYSEDLDLKVRSALLGVFQDVDYTDSLKNQYREHEALRPFIQYLAHAAATEGPARAIATLEELLQASLANVQVETVDDARAMRDLARRYLIEISNKSVGFLKAADTTGLSSFSFDELYAKIGDDPVLRQGPGAVLDAGEKGLFHLIDVLRYLPELGLGIGFGSGPMNVQAVAKVVQGWMEGRTVAELAEAFPGEDINTKVRNAGKYVYGTVSQTISWGAHAYMRGLNMADSARQSSILPEEAMLGAYIQFGVKTPEAAVASLLGIPRELAEGFGSEYRAAHGTLTPDRAPFFRSFVEDANTERWESVVERVGLSINPEDVRMVWRQMQGLA